jgi:hypothetical protein
MSESLASCRKLGTAAKCAAFRSVKYNGIASSDNAFHGSVLLRA